MTPKPLVQIPFKEWLEKNPVTVKKDDPKC